MKLFWKVFAAVFISFVIVISLISYVISHKQISDAKEHLVEKNRIIGSFISKEIELDYRQSKWPFETLSKVSKRDDFLFWWVVKEDGKIHLADKESFMGTDAYAYFPQMANKKSDLLLDLDRFLGISLQPLRIGHERWSFWLGFSLHEISQTKRGIVLLEMGVSVAAFLVLGIILYYIVRHFIRPIGDIATGAQLIGSGHLNHRLKIRSGDELGQLAISFNRMAGELHERGESLRESEERYRTLFEQSRDTIGIVTQEGQFIDINRSFSDLLGYKREELLGMNARDVWADPSDRSRWQQEIAEKGSVIDYEWKARRKDGTIRDCILNSTARHMQDGSIHIQTINRDVTDKKHAEEALRKSEERFRSLVETTSDWIWELDKNGVYTYASPKVKDILGYEPGEVIGKTPFDFMPQDEAERVSAIFGDIVATQRPFERLGNVNIHKDGRFVVLDTSGVPIFAPNGNLLGYRGIDRDITERKLAEDELKYQKKHLESLIRYSSLAIVTLDDNHNVISCNRYFEDLFQFKESEILNKNLDELISGQKYLEDARAYTRKTREGEAIQGSGKRYRKDGTSIDVEFFGVPVIVDGKVVGAYGIYRDIGERKRAEEALKKAHNELEQRVKERTAELAAQMEETEKLNCAMNNLLDDLEASNRDLHQEIDERKRAEKALLASESKFRTLYESSRDAVMVLDDEKFIDCNSATLEIFGYASREEFCGKHPSELSPTTQPNGRDSRSLADERISTALKNGGNFFEWLHRRMDGTDFPAEVLLSAMELEDKPVLQAVVRDITERKRAEEEVKKHAEQLEAVNKELDDFAHIVSHDLKAPLRAVSQLAQWISMDYADAFDEKGKEHLGLLMGRVKRMYGLIDGILQYSRLGRIREKEEQMDLNTLVKDVVETLGPPENIQISIESALPNIVGDRTRMMQIFQNLFSNAIKFMDKPRGEVKVGCLDEGNWWKFSVSDNGPGVEERYYEKIFQIFQTLRPRDEQDSTGIGLTLVKKIVESFGGKIWVESDVGRGTTFFFTLPKDSATKTQGH